MPNAVSYGRVSDIAQTKGKSVSDQLAICREYAKKKGITVIAEFCDEGKTGTNLSKRDGALEALAAIADEDVAYLLVSETDRIARNADENFLIKKHLAKHECKLIAVTQPYTESDNEESHLMGGIMAQIDEYFSKINGKKTKRAMIKKLERGEWPGQAPLGYRNANIGTDENPHRIIQNHELTTPLVKEALELFSTGNYTPERLRDFMHSERGLRSRNGKKIPKSSFTYILRNPFYYGVMEYDGVMYPNKDKEGKETYKPLIDKSLYDRNIEILKENGHHADRSRKHDERFFLRTFIRCGICGGRVTAEVHEEKGKEYYHCSLTKQKHSNKGQNMDAKELEHLIAQLFGQIQLTEPLMQRIVARAKEILVETRSSADSKKKAVQNRINKLEMRRDHLEEDRLDRVMDAEEFQRQHRKIKDEMETLKRQMNELDDDREVNIDIFNKFMALTDDLKKTYANAESPLKRHLIALFFDRIAIKDRGISEVQYTKAIQVLRDNRSVIISDKWLPEFFMVRTVLDASKDTMSPIVYLGSFRPWREEVELLQAKE